MKILFGLAVATVLVIGWTYGNVFACVFLTLGTIGIIGFGALLAFAHGNATDHTFGGWTVVIGLSVPRHHLGAVFRAVQRSQLKLT